MRKFLLILISIVLFVVSSEAQTKKSTNKKVLIAQEYFVNNNYESAKKAYSELLESNKKSLKYNFYTGICEIQTDEEYSAIERFDVIINDYKKQNKQSEYTKAAIFYKALAYHNLYQFDEEKETLNSLSSFELNDNEKKQLQNSLLGSENAKKLFFDFKPIIVTRLDIINSGYDDHTPIPTANGTKLYFTSKRPGGISGENISPEGKYYEDIWSWEENSEPINLGAPVNTKEHDATGGLSLDGKTIFVYRASKKKLGDIYSSQWENNEWTKPEKLGKNINKRKSIERHAALSPDGTKLYFSSDRKGGIGGRDIWVTEKNEDGNWGEPKTVNINTETDEESPYLLADGMTFYFSSKGHNGMGGYDIYKCMLQSDGTFSKPENVGFPINTVEDDVFFFPLSDEETAYFTRRKSDNAEIFKTIFPYNSLIVESNVSGKELDLDLYPIGKSDINVLDVDSDIEPDAYTLFLEKGKYKSVVLQDKNYKFYYEAQDYVFDTENIAIEDMIGVELIQKNPVLVKIEEGKTEKYKNTDFDSESDDFNNFTETELDLIAENLIKYENLVVNFSTENYLTKADDLSKLRKEKAVEYIKTKGISADRIYIDLSPRDINTNILEYTIYDTESVKKAIQDKVNNTQIAIDKELIVEVENMFFNFDKSKLNIAPNQNLDVLVKYLIDNKNAKIAIIGYTDEVGSNTYNDKLSKERADAVKRYLVENGVVANQVETFGYGENNPVTLNKKSGKYFEPSKKFNRRVEFNMLLQGNPKLKIVQLKNVPDEYKDADYNSSYKR